ncbi:hypothetical protein [Paenibacillus polymyxa]|uniref:hypothetical protein n=1 Tax=Paenibacillus polymyxa TaxID=1406 RepID=UPI0008B81CF1|nr:hypothetical protein [Paenibacillus polymyxa]SEI74639.1 hypothetical protein SAMN04488600_101568 [Paenibacillus polymyxa]
MLNFDIVDFERVVPKPLLEFYLDKLDVEADRRGFATMYEGLNSCNSKITKAIYENYKYAGRTAVNIFEEITLPSNYLTRERVIKYIKKEVGAENIFNKEFRPPLSDHPQINYVEERNNSLLIQYVLKGRERRVRNGYEVVTISSVEFEYAIIHFNGPNFVELRCAYNAHSKFLGCIEGYIRDNDEIYKTHKFEWSPVTKTTNAEAEKIATILSAGLIEADHKDDGIYDRHLVTASPRVKDLRQENEYIEQFKNKMLLSQNLIINYTEKTPYGDYNREIKFKINLNSGFQFLSKVSEPVIDYVMKVFIDTRYSSDDTMKDEKVVETIAE